MTQTLTTHNLLDQSHPVGHTEGLLLPAVINEILYAHCFLRIKPMKNYWIKGYNTLDVSDTYYLKKVKSIQIPWALIFPTITQIDSTLPPKLLPI